MTVDSEVIVWSEITEPIDAGNSEATQVATIQGVGTEYHVFDVSTPVSPVTTPMQWTTDALPRRRHPCAECPWRVDTPPGQFSACRYDALENTTGRAGAEGGGVRRVARRRRARASRRAARGRDGPARPRRAATR